MAKKGRDGMKIGRQKVGRENIGREKINRWIDRKEDRLIDSRIDGGGVTRTKSKTHLLIYFVGVCVFNIFQRVSQNNN